MKILKEYQYKNYDIEYPKNGAYGVTVAKGGKVVHEAENDKEAEEWIDEQVDGKKDESICESMDQLETGTSAALMNLINSEYDLLSQYESAQITFNEEGEPKFDEVFNYIKDDINIHIGMLQAALENINPSTEKIDDGKEQGEDLIG